MDSFIHYDQEFFTLTKLMICWRHGIVISVTTQIHARRGIWRLDLYLPTNLQLMCILVSIYAFERIRELMALV